MVDISEGTITQAHLAQHSPCLASKVDLNRKLRPLTNRTNFYALAEQEKSDLGIKTVSVNRCNGKNVLYQFLYCISAKAVYSRAVGRFLYSGKMVQVVVVSATKGDEYYLSNLMSCGEKILTLT